jgi:hypothetical protein
MGGERAADHGLTPAIAAQVVRVTPPDLSIVDSELKKLAAYKASGSKLTPEAISELLAGGREDEIFKLTDNLLPRPTAEALKIARGLTRGGMQPTSIAYRMARHMALVLQVRARQTAASRCPRSRKNVRASLRPAEGVRRGQRGRLERWSAALRAIRDYEVGGQVRTGRCGAWPDVRSRGSGAKLLFGGSRAAQRFLPQPWRRALLGAAAGAFCPSGFPVQLPEAPAEASRSAWPTGDLRRPALLR